VFDPGDAEWRGLGVIPGSGLRIRHDYEEFDALKRFTLPEIRSVEFRGCRCGEILRGVMAPAECLLFMKACTPSNPVGPCMVSSEGTCAAYYKYERTGDR
jgi:hydrogenase expression/formation protein HypD